MAPQLLVLALEFHRAPLRFRHLTDPRRPLPEVFGDCLLEASGALAPANVEATAEVLGTTPETLREAYRFLLRQVLLVPQADHYRVLGLSRCCASGSIKAHRGLLVRLFHPDHLPETDERSISLTVRINAAYQVLRDPQARRRYDSSLPPAEGSHDGPSGFLQPHRPLASVSGRRRTPRALAWRARSVLLWILVCVVLMALVYLVVREPWQPSLRVNPELVGATLQDRSDSPIGEVPSATIEPPGQIGGEPSTRPNRVAQPTIHPMAIDDARDGADASASEPLADASDPAISGGAQQEHAVTRPSGISEPEVAGTARDGNAPESEARKSVSVLARRRPQGPGGGEGSEGTKRALGIRQGSRDTSPQPADLEHQGEAGATQGVSGLVRRLEQCFASGDLAGMVRLFTANAVVNDRVGGTGVRNTYTDIVGQTGQGRMTLSGLRWRAGQYDLLLGRGTIHVSTKRGPERVWSDANGTVEIELVPWMGDYRISKFVHHLSRK